MRPRLTRSRTSEPMDPAGEKPKAAWPWRRRRRSTKARKPSSVAIRTLSSTMMAVLVRASLMKPPPGEPRPGGGPLDDGACPFVRVGAAGFVASLALGLPLGSISLLPLEEAGCVPCVFVLMPMVLMLRGEVVEEATPVGVAVGVAAGVLLGMVVNPLGEVAGGGLDAAVAPASSKPGVSG